MIPMNFIDQFKERFAFRIRDLGEGVPHDRSSRTLVLRLAM
jgi:hypothetical protein